MKATSMAQQGDLGEKISKLPKEAGEGEAGEGEAGEGEADQEIGAGEGEEAGPSPLSATE